MKCYRCNGTGVMKTKETMRGQININCEACYGVGELKIKWNWRKEE